MTASYFEVDLTIEIAFGYGPTDTPVWTDVSDYVREYTVDRGRRDEFGSYSPGMASVTLSNLDRRFDPEHAAGAYFGDLLPMVPLRIVATYSAVDYPVFYGFVQGWPQQYVDNIDSTVTVRCVDAFRLLEQATLAESAYRYEVEADGPIAYYPFTGGLVDLIGDGSLTVTSGAFDSGAVSWYPTGAVEANATGSALMSTPTLLGSAPRAIEFVIDADTFNGSTSDYNVLAQHTDTDYLRAAVFDDKVQFSFSNTAMNRKMDVVSISSDILTWFQTGRTYHIVLTIEADNTADLYVDGALISSVSLAVGTLSLSVDTTDISVTTGNRLAQFAVYDAPLDAARIAAHYNAGATAWGGDYVEYPDARIGRVLDAIGWPAGTRDLSTGGIELGPYLPAARQALDYIREVETTEQGLFYVTADGDLAFRDRAWQFDQTSSATFGTGGLGFFDVVPEGNTVDVVRNQVKVIYDQSDSNVVVEDATSIAAYGYMSDSLSTPLIQTINPARGLASFRVRVGKDPRSRVSSLLVKPRSDPADLFPAVLGVELGDVVTVTFTPVGVGSASTYVTSVQGIRQSVGRGEFDVEFYLAPAVSESGPYFKVGDATLGRVGAAYANKLSY